MRARCLRLWLQDGWPSFRLAHTLLPSLTSRPLLALWSSHEHHSIFFLIALLTFYTKIGAIRCIYALFGSLVSHGLIDSSSSLFFCFFVVLPSFLIITHCLYPLFYNFFIYYHVSFFATSDDFSHFNAWRTVMSHSTPISWTSVRRSLVEKVLVRESSPTSLFESISISLCILRGVHLLIFRVCAKKKR